MTQPNLEGMKEVARKGLQWINDVPEKHTDTCTWVNVGVSCGCGREEAALHAQLFAYCNFPTLATSYLELLKEKEELEKDKARMDYLTDEVAREFKDEETTERHIRLHHDFGWVVGDLRTAVDAEMSVSLPLGDSK